MKSIPKLVKLQSLNGKCCQMLNMNIPLWILQISNHHSYGQNLPPTCVHFPGRQLVPRVLSPPLRKVQSKFPPVQISNNELQNYSQEWKTRMVTFQEDISQFSSRLRLLKREKKSHSHTKITIILKLPTKGLREKYRLPLNGSAHFEFCPYK
jgi:hypothetical protein